MVSVSPAAPHSLNAAAPAPLRILLDGIDRLGRLDGWIGGGCLLMLTLLMLCEVATRFLSNFLPFFPPTISIAWEYSSYLMAASFTFGAAMTLRVGGHIRVVLLLKNVPALFQRAIEILSAAAGFGFMAFLTWSMAKFAFGAYVRGQVFDLERHSAVVSAGRRHLRHAAANAPVPGARDPGRTRPAAGGSPHEGLARRMIALLAIGFKFA
ncbi:TRAP-type mannitol/chloroaromatic compound transport system permease small subunit [Bradyrhizobium sp. LM3.2]